MPSSTPQGDCLHYDGNAQPISSFPFLTDMLSASNMTQKTRQRRKEPGRSASVTYFL
ncbi:UNVERIFIED_CONTAM: hypothetical protein FKN15_060011 [Acipenser sinensis]